ELALGQGDLALVGGDRGRGVVALGGDLGAAGIEAREALLVAGDLRPAALGERASLGAPLADLGERFAAPLDELLASLDAGVELGMALVALRDQPAELLEPLAAGGERGLVAVQVGGQAGLALDRPV